MGLLKTPPGGCLLPCAQTTLHYRCFDAERQEPVCKTTGSKWHSCSPERTGTATLQELWPAELPETTGELEGELRQSGMSSERRHPPPPHTHTPPSSVPCRAVPRLSPSSARRCLRRVSTSRLGSSAFCVHFLASAWPFLENMAGSRDRHPRQQPGASGRRPGGRRGPRGSAGRGRAPHSAAAARRSRDGSAGQAGRWEGRGAASSWRHGRCWEGGRCCAPKTLRLSSESEPEGLGRNPSESFSKSPGRKGIFGKRKERGTS